MANILSKGSLFPAELTNEMFNLVKGKSSLARLSAGHPIPFNGQTVFTFNLDKDIDIVAENDPKSNGGATVGTVTIQPIKIEYGTRVSDEFMYAAEEVQLQYLKAFADGFAAKVARGIDIMAMHGLNPRSGAQSNVIGDNHFDQIVTQTVIFDSANASANVSAAVDLVQGNEHEVSGMAMAPAFRSALAALTKGEGSAEYLFPELAWGRTPDSMYGLTIDSNPTVSFRNNTDRAILGNFRDFFRWGYAKEIPIEIIEYGNPDNDIAAGDLKGHNQIYIRGEAYVGWGILVPEAFARIVAETEENL